MEMIIRIGTRGSRLALWQAYHIEELLKRQGVGSEIITIQTKGDLILDKTLSKLGSKGIFTEELETALRDGSIDIAVHSAKDVQSELPDDLELIAFTEREETNDVLVSYKKDISLLKGPHNFVIGTSSTRRTATLRHYFPNIKIVDMRGNLQTRLKKLEDGQCDALLLAYAGVHRMEYDEHIIEKLPLNIFTPPVGQGSVAVQSAKSLASDKKELIIKATNHEATAVCLKAERSFLKKLHGGCSIPSFALAELTGDVLKVSAGLISLDGKKVIKYSMSSTPENGEKMGDSLAVKILKDGGDELLKEIRSQLDVS